MRLWLWYNYVCRSPRHLAPETIVKSSPSLSPKVSVCVDHSHWCIRIFMIFVSSSLKVDVWSLGVILLELYLVRISFTLWGMGMESVGFTVLEYITNIVPFLYESLCTLYTCINIPHERYFERAGHTVVPWPLYHEFPVSTVQEDSATSTELPSSVLLCVILYSLYVG